MKLSFFKNKSKNILDKKNKIELGHISNRRLIFLIFVVFALFEIFNDDSPLVANVRTRIEIREVKQEIQNLEQEMKQDCVIIDQIKNNRQFLIRYAREKLYMSEENEEIFLITD